MTGRADPSGGSQRLTDAEKDEIQAEVDILPSKEAASVEALKVVQRHRGWVSDEALRAVARHLQVSEAGLENVATFYNLIFRRPVGRHIILVCDSVSCWVMGCDRVRSRIEDILEIRPGQTTVDERFTLLPMQCLGACDRAPVLMVDEDLHVRVAYDAIDEILEEYH